MNKIQKIYKNISNLAEKITSDKSVKNYKSQSVKTFLTFLVQVTLDLLIGVSKWGHRINLIRQDPKSGKVDPVTFVRKLTSTVKIYIIIL